MLPVLRRGMSIFRRDPRVFDAAGRRKFLKFGAAAAGGALFGPGVAVAGETGAFPPQDAPWSQSLGAGIVDRPYGRPSDFVKDVIRRNVPWLTASKESSVSFSPLQDLNGIITPNGLFFERYHAGRAEVDPRQAPPDDPRHGGAAARSYHEGHRALSVGVAHPFHRMSGERRHGVARGAAQLVAIHPRHGELRGMDRREALHAAAKRSASRKKRNGCSSRAPTART